MELRSRSRMFFGIGDSTPEDQAQNPAPENVSAHYDHTRLSGIEEIIARNTDRDLTATPVAHASTISMRDALAALENGDYQNRTDLTDNQKKLITIVDAQRKDPDGQTLIKMAAGRDEYLAINNTSDAGGSTSDSLGTIFISLKNNKWKNNFDDEALKIDMRHELIHAIQPPVPPNLSSYDQALWEMGKEGQAMVGAENLRRHDKGLPPLDAQGARKIFGSLMSYDINEKSHYVDYYGIDQTTRSDGRHLTMHEFNKAFGVLPGHENEPNFLAGGQYKDPADIFDTSPGGDSFSQARKQAEQKPLAFNELPEPGAGTKRFDSKDRDQIVYVSFDKGSDQAHVDIYKRINLPNGPAYVKVDESTTDAVHDPNGADKKGNHLIYAVVSKTSTGNSETLHIALDKHDKVKVSGVLSTDAEGKFPVDDHGFKEHKPEKHQGPAPVKLSRPQSSATP